MKGYPMNGNPVRIPIGLILASFMVLLGYLAAATIRGIAVLR